MDKVNTKANALALAIKEVIAESNAVSNIWYRVSGIVASEEQRLWNEGYNIDTLQLIKGLRSRLNDVINEQEKIL